MILVCPQCDTHFTVPESALGRQGRTVRCARCAHKWHASPPPRDVDDDVPEADDDFDIPLEAPPASRPRPPPPEPAFSGADGEFAMESPGGGPVDYAAMNFGAEDDAAEREPGEDPFSQISELMMSNQPEEIPEVFSAPPKPAPRRKGGAVLLILAVVVLLTVAGAGLYFAQDYILDHFPGLGKYYDTVGVRRDDVVGFGLAFRNCSSERTVEDGNEVLIVRGVIENTTAQTHDVPLLSLVLYNNKTVVQEKIINPPQPSLAAKATVGFSLTLDQPDASATRFEITFTAAKPGRKPEAPPSKPAGAT